MKRSIEWDDGDRTLSCNAVDRSSFPWFGEIANYLAAEHEPTGLWGTRRRSSERHRRYFWDEPYLYKHCTDGVYRRCVADEEIPGILFHCHSSSYAGHFATYKTVSKALQAGYWWPTMFRDAHRFVSKCDVCQRQGNISKRNEMPQNFILEVEWVEALASPTNDAKVVMKMFKSVIFPRFGVPRVVISDGGSHFINRTFDNMLKRHGVKHKVATPYHPQTSGQVELSNREIKNIPSKTAGTTGKDWACKVR
ncbi:unnamed protein product [Microthlaspi erraticum]|uniref:Integrase catalytic domain-containing protein n=1 Tax=Microthlaspi erraticum TaxID=1685480 RepID=A0A6D2J4V3_9BRAS|nr:unnamed protein product [Microthlaspi erraticum]